jgi:GxxExxY protein
MRAQNLAFEPERSICVVYRGVEIPGQRVDLIVAGEIVVELKAITRFDPVHTAQLISYLHSTGLRGGLLINFRVPALRMGLKRIVV